jgi:hypothetical protein
MIAERYVTWSSRADFARSRTCVRISVVRFGGESFTTVDIARRNCRAERTRGNVYLSARQEECGGYGVDLGQVLVEMVETQASRENGEEDGVRGFQVGMKGCCRRRLEVMIEQGDESVDSVCREHGDEMLECIKEVQCVRDGCRMSPRDD